MVGKKELKSKIQAILIENSDYCKQELVKFTYTNNKPLIQVKISEISTSYKIDLEETEKAIKKLFINISDLTVISSNKEQQYAIWEMKEDVINIDGRLSIWEINKNKPNKIEQKEFIKKFATNEKEGIKLWNKIRDSFGEKTKYTNYILGTDKNTGEDIIYRIVKKLNKKDVCLLCGINLNEGRVNHIIMKKGI